MYFKIEEKRGLIEAVILGIVWEEKLLPEPIATEVCEKHRRSLGSCEKAGRDPAWWCFSPPSSPLQRLEGLFRPASLRRLHHGGVHLDPGYGAV